MNTLFWLLIAVLIVLVALLWYGVRTHKTVSELESKVKASAGEIAAYAITKATAKSSDAAKP